MADDVTKLYSRSVSSTKLLSEKLFCSIVYCWLSFDQFVKNRIFLMCGRKEKTPTKKRHDKRNERRKNFTTKRWKVVVLYWFREGFNNYTPENFCRGKKNSYYTHWRPISRYSRSGELLYFTACPLTFILISFAAFEIDSFVKRAKLFRCTTFLFFQFVDCFIFETYYYAVIPRLRHVSEEIRYTVQYCMPGIFPGVRSGGDERVF